jgi:hypothetical protein
MPDWKKIVIGTGITAGLVAIGYKLFRTKKTGQQLEVISSAMIHKVDTKGISIRINAVLKNPGNGKLVIKQPFMKLEYKGSLLGSSQVSNQDIEIPAFSQQTLEPIYFNIPMKGIFSIAFGLIQSITRKEEVKVTVKAMTSIFLGLGRWLPYETVQEVTLVKGKAG